MKTCSTLYRFRRCNIFADKNFFSRHIIFEVVALLVTDEDESLLEKLAGRDPQGEDLPPFL